MEYKKKYKEALELMKDCIPDKDGLVHIRPCEIFPELKKSEDERIRKAIIEHFEGSHSSTYPYKGFTKEQILAWLEKQGEQKPTDEVKPKFNVGDWVVYCNEDVDLITGIEEKGYRINEGGYIPFVCEDDMRLWTIQDAKDGDIIVNDFVGGTCVAIYKSFTNDGTNIYCHLVNNDFCQKHGTSNAKWHPSTKEQRDLLFQKMEEAGYEWNDEKKELKMAESVQPELPNGEDYGIDSLYHAERILEKTLGEVEGYQSDDGILEHKCAIEEVKRLYKQKPTWSEEDKMLLEKIISDYTAASKSFCGCQGKLDWLKSLKERYTWKPSDEQMEALYTYIYNPQYFNSPDQRMELVESVYKDLKKLREE